jgi:hypothetical protein
MEKATQDGDPPGADQGQAGTPLHSGQAVRSCSPDKSWSGSRLDREAIRSQ